jgi:transposase InsO family protein
VGAAQGAGEHAARAPRRRAAGAEHRRRSAQALRPGQAAQAAPARAALGHAVSDCSAPNDLWCADFKGWFHAADGNRCEPLTVSDAHSRFLLKCQIVPNTSFSSVRPILEAAFREYGLPKAMRTDNGPPFASVGLGGLSSFTVWLTHLGIAHERITPGRPQENGRHERIHRTLKQETALPPRPTLGQQQCAFDEWRQEYNHKRPHEALGQKTPAEVYRPSDRAYPDVLPEIVYPVTPQAR